MRFRDRNYSGRLPISGVVVKSEYCIYNSCYVFDRWLCVVVGDRILLALDSINFVCGLFHLDVAVLCIETKWSRINSTLSLLLVAFPRSLSGLVSGGILYELFRDRALHNFYSEPSVLPTDVSLLCQES
jgi:hypothetical protein